MEITIDKEQLQNAFLRAASIVQKKTVTPISGTVQFAVDNDKLTFSGKGNEIMACIEVEKENFKLDESIEEKLSVYIPADIFSQLLQSLPGYLSKVVRLNIEKSGDGYVLGILPPKSEKKKSHYRIVAQADEGSFFDAPTVCGESINIKNSNLLEIIDKVTFASAPDQYRMIYMGINFVIGDDKLVTACTNGHRVAELTLDAKDAREEDFIFYARSLENTKHIFDFEEDSSDFKLFCGDTYIKIEQDDRTVYINILAENQFPEYRKSNVVPDEFPTELEVEANELKELLVPAALLTDVRIILSFTKDGIVIVTESPKGSSQDTLDTIKWIKGKNVDNMELSVGYFIEQLNKFKNEKIMIKLIDSSRPLILCKDNYMQILSCIRRKAAEEAQDDSEEE